MLAPPSIRIRGDLGLPPQRRPDQGRAAELAVDDLQAGAVFKQKDDDLLFSRLGGLDQGGGALPAGGVRLHAGLQKKGNLFEVAGLGALDEGVGVVGNLHLRQPLTGIFLCLRPGRHRGE